MEAKIKTEDDLQVDEELPVQKDSDEVKAVKSEKDFELPEMSETKRVKKSSASVASVMSSPDPRSSIESDTKTNKESTNGSAGPHKRRHADTEVTSDDDEDFVGFDKSELDNSEEYIPQNVKKLRHELSDDEMSPQKKAGQQQKIDISDPAYRVPFTYGWKRELVLRADPNNSKEKGEVYYLTPNGKKLRTRQEIQNHLHDDLTISNFTLVKVAIGADPEDELIRPAKFYNFSRRSAETTPEPTSLGKRTIKVKLPKGASPPSSPLNTPVSKSALIKTPTSRPMASTPKPNIAPGFARNAAKENHDSFTPPISPVGKPLAKKIKESTSKAGNNKNQRNTVALAVVGTSSPFNFSSNFFCNVSAGYGILLQTFQYLKVQELQRASCVCRMWNQLAHHKALWRTVRMKNSHVNDWQGFVNTLKRNGTKHLDLRKMFVTNQDESWKEFLDNIGVISKLEQIDLCRCHSSVVENLFRTNPNLKVINAVSLKDDKIDLCGLRNVEGLEELRLRTTSSNGLQLLKVMDIVDLQPFENLKHLSLTTFHNLDSLLNNNDNWGNLVQLESLELGFCENVSDQQLTNNLGGMINLQRLRIEKGINSFNIDVILATISSELHKLVQLELINCDVKPGFEESIRKCRNLRKLLLIPTYVSQSAATNFMILNGVTQLRQLDTFVWVVTNELLRVTELYIDQCDNKSEKSKKSDKNMPSPVKVSDSIPILKPVPGLDTNDNVDEQQQQTQTADTPQQVDIVQLKVVDTILNKKLPNTKVKLLKLAHLLTWRQTLDLQ